MNNIHAHYDKLTYNQRAMVDEIMHAAFSEAKCREIPLWGDDSAEYVADAIAKWILISDPATDAEPSARL